MQEIFCTFKLNWTISKCNTFWGYLVLSTSPFCLRFSLFLNVAIINLTLSKETTCPQKTYEGMTYLMVRAIRHMGQTVTGACEYPGTYHHITKL